MMEFTHEESGTRFTIPDKITVGQHLTHRAVLGDQSAGDIFVRNWDAGVTLIDEWDSPLIPDCTAVDFSANNDSLETADLIVWVGITIATHMNELRSVPKN